LAAPTADSPAPASAASTTRGARATVTIASCAGGQSGRTRPGKARWAMIRQVSAKDTSTDPAMMPNVAATGTAAASRGSSTGSGTGPRRGEGRAARPGPAALSETVVTGASEGVRVQLLGDLFHRVAHPVADHGGGQRQHRSEEHTSELQSRENRV